MNRAAYDFETNSIETNAANPVVQFAYKDDDQEINVTAKLGLNYPNIEAILIHGQAPQKGELTQLEIAQVVQQVFNDTKADCVAGYNNHAFDDKVMQHLLFAKGLNPYVLKNKEILSLDIFKMAIKASVVGTEALNIALNDSDKPMMSLSAISSANGIELDAHDAMNDLVATLELARKVEQGDPEFWANFLSDNDAIQTMDLLAQCEPLLRAGKGGYAIYKTPFLPLALDEEKPHQVIGIKLDDPKRLTKLLSLSPDDIKGLMSKEPKERPKGFQSKTGSGIPLIKVKLDSPILLDAVFLDEAKQEAFDLSINVLKDFPDHEKLCLSAFEGKREYGDRQNPEDRLYDCKTSGWSGLVFNPNDPISFASFDKIDVFSEAKQFEGDEETIAGLLIAMKFDLAFDGVPIDQLIEYIEQLASKNEGAAYELKGYLEILEARVGLIEEEGIDQPCFKEFTSDKFKASLDKLAQKKPELLEGKEELVMEVSCHIDRLCMVNQAIKQVTKDLPVTYKEYLKEQFDGNYFDIPCAVSA